jgi:hypothetical protein
VFTYRIRAFNDFGNSEWSNICIVNKARLDRPTRLRAASVAAHKVELRWRDNAEGESHLELQRRPAGSIKWKSIKVLPADTRTVIDTGVDNGKSYEYRIRARGFLEECIGHSRFSRVLQVTTPAN